MLVFSFNVILIIAVTILSYKYLDLRERFSENCDNAAAYLKGVSKLTDSFEGYSAPHAAQMAVDAMEIAKTMGLDNIFCHKLELASLLHDCGELQLPGEILKTKAALTPEDWFLVKTHTLLGEMALREKLDPTNEVSSIIRWHHERWDGAGYPDRLAGVEIPLASRILCLVDAVSAMKNDRPHRPAKDQKEIERIVESLAGLQFDPEVAEAWLKTTRKAKRELER